MIIFINKLFLVCYCMKTGLVEQKNNFKLKPDSSIYSLIIANILILVLAIIENWSLGPLLIIYWWQSIIIGLFNFIKITRLKNFHTNHLKSRGKQLPANELTKMGMAFFFAFHYGIFHVAYLFFIAFMFLFTGESFSLLNLGFIALGVLIFFFNHLFSFLKNKDKDAEKRQSLGKVMFFPYLRIIPMHLTMVFGLLFFGRIGVIIFLILKTVADVIMHKVEHR